MRTTRTGAMRLAVRRGLVATAAAIALMGALLPTAAAAPDPNDPRVGLGAGLDAQQASLGVDLLANVPRPAAFAPRSSSFSFATSDMAFTETHAFVGNFHGFLIYDLTTPHEPTLVSATVCPGGQGDLSIFGDLLFMSVEESRGRVDCGSDASVGQRFQGLRIFDVSDVTRPVQVAAVQTCRGSHTHTLVDAPDGDRLYAYVSGTASVRPDGTNVGLTCVRTGPASADHARWRIEVIEIPLAAPQDAHIVNAPRLFEETGRVDGLQQAPPAPNHPSGGSWSPSPVTDACHDITAYPQIGLAAGACEGNGILIDISDPANPVRVAAVADPNFAYWHSATFNNAGDAVVFTDEWGGGSGARCRATDALNWGANAIFDIIDTDAGPQLEFASYYKMPAVQTAQENCVAHNGNLLPHPDRDLMVQAWYQGGLSIFDFTDTANPREIAYFDRGPLDGAALTLGGYWSAYFFNGYLYGSEIARGLDVLALTPTDALSEDEIDTITGHRWEEHNPQHQHPFVLDAGTDLMLAVSATTRCVAGSIYLTVTARNDNDLPIDVTISHEVGTRSFTAVAPHRFASHAFNTRAGSIDAESVTVSARALTDGQETTVDQTVDVDASSCTSSRGRGYQSATTGSMP